MMATTDREKALESALAQIDKQYGKGSVMRLGDEVRAPIEVIPTGSIALDVALGIGGCRAAGWWRSTGRSPAARPRWPCTPSPTPRPVGGICAFIDAEHALDPDYAAKLGVDTDSLLVSQPDNGEQALEIADMLVRSGALALIVIDSVAALTPRAEIEGEMGDSHVGLQARLMSQALRKMTGALSGAGTTAIFINQLREKIGVMFGPGDHHRWPGTEVLLLDPAGRAADRDPQGRPGDGRQPDPGQGGEEQGGAAVQAGRVRHPVRQGISREGSLLDLGVDAGIVRKAGAWFTYDADQLGQGRENARNYLRNNPDLANELEKKIKERMGIGPQVDLPAGIDPVTGEVEF